MGECLSAKQLEQLAAGLLEESKSAALRAHLNECETCRERFEDCSANLAFLAKAKTGLGGTGLGKTAGNTGPANAESSSSIHTAPTLVRAPIFEAGKTALVLSIEIPGYQIIRDVHFGGQGVIYEAIQTSTKRKVAIKVLLEGSAASKAAIRRFEREVELVSSFKHPNIIAIYDSGIAPDGRHFYVMDYIHGLTLGEYVRQKDLAISKTLDLFCDVCQAVNYAHQRGVIHRDLKPSNVLVTEEGDAKVLDFGLAKWMSAPVSSVVSRTGQILGTLAYMSPEQVRGNVDDMDIRSDVYSLGVILYELLTGQYPYPTDGDLPQICKHITETPPAPPSQTWAAQAVATDPSRRKQPARSACRVDNELETILFKCLQKERDRRYQTAGDLGRDLRNYLTGEPIEAKRDSTIYVLRKKLRKHRGKVTAACAFLGLVIAAGVAVSIQRTLIARQQGDLQRATAGEIVAAFMQDPGKALVRLEDSDPNIRVNVVEICANYLQSDSYTRRMMGAPAGLLVNPDAFWKSVDGGPLWKNGEWLEVCRVNWPNLAPILDQLRTHAKTGTDRQKYVAFCLLGELAGENSELADLCGEAVQREVHTGVVSAAKWAAERLGKPIAYRPGSNLFADDVSGLTFVRIPATDGFRPGSPRTDPDRYPDEESRERSVALPSYYMSTTEISLLDVAKFMRTPKGNIVPDDTKANIEYKRSLLSEQDASRTSFDRMTMTTAKAYTEWLTEKGEVVQPARRYRIPSETQWEYACRGGNAGRFCFGNDAGYVGYFADCNAQVRRPHFTAQFMPNFFGLFDMHGGQWEWCDTLYPSEFLPERIRKLKDFESRKFYVQHGGARSSPAVRCRSAQRKWQDSRETYTQAGLRLVLVLEDAKP